MSENKALTKEFIYKSILKNLDNYKNKTIDVQRLIKFSAETENFISQIKIFYYNNFEEVISKLCDEKILYPKGKIKKGDNMYCRYEIAKNIKVNNYDHETTFEISKLRLPNLDYYIKNQKEYKKHKQYLIQLANYYNLDEKPKLTSNELGFKLFNDEKFFENPNKISMSIKSDVQRETTKLRSNNLGLQILNNLKMTYEDYNSYRTIEPFFHTVHKSFFEKNIRKILIVENKDTFFRFKKLKLINLFDMMIYGEGNKIQNSFELASDFGIKKIDEILYFGDIDSEGFKIYGGLKSRFSQYNIRLYLEVYRKLINGFDLNSLPQLKIKGKPEVLEKALEIIIQEFDEELFEITKKILVSRKYLPQEAIVLIKGL